MTREEREAALLWLRGPHMGSDSIPNDWERRVLTLLVALDQRITTLEHEVDERLRPLENF